MQIKFIRGTSLLIKSGDKNFLVDPVLAPKGGDIVSKLPINETEIIKSLDAILVTCVDDFHLDKFSIDTLRKGLKVFVRSEEEKNELRKLGFSNLTVLPVDGFTFAGTRMYKTENDNSMGIIFSYYEEKPIYILGSSNYCSQVQKNIEEYNPEYVIVDCAFTDCENLKLLYENNPNLKFIIIGLETFKDTENSRKSIKKYVKDNKFDKSVLIPNDGDVYKI